MNKNSFVLIIAFIGIAAVSLFAYRKNSQPLNLAAEQITNINLDIYTKRGAVQKPKAIAPKPEQTASIDIQPAIQAIDPQFVSAPLQALASYQQLLEQDPGHLGLRLRLGMLQLKLQQLDAAKEHLYMVYEQKEAGLQPDAAWFLALLAIKEQQQEKAKQLLQESIQAESNYREQAQQLLQSF